VFGGYNHVGWMKFQKDEYYKDKDAKGFLFRHEIFKYKG